MERDYTNDDAATSRMAIRAIDAVRTAKERYIADLVMGLGRASEGQEQEIIDVRPVGQYPDTEIEIVFRRRSDKERGTFRFPVWGEDSGLSDDRNECEARAMRALTEFRGGSRTV